MAVFPSKAKNLTKEMFFSVVTTNGANTHTYADLMRYCPFECLDINEGMEISAHIIAQFHGFMSVIDTTYNSTFINGTSIFGYTGIAVILASKEPKYFDLVNKFTQLSQANPNYSGGGSLGELLIAAKKDGTGYFSMVGVGQIKAAATVQAQGSYFGVALSYTPVDLVARTKTIASPLIIPFLTSFNRNV